MSHLLNELVLTDHSLRISRLQEGGQRLECVWIDPPLHWVI